MVYATFSKGFRPGGMNRRTAGAAAARHWRPTTPDFLTNYEIGYKTSWLDNHLRFNGAFFWRTGRTSSSGSWVQNSFTIIAQRRLGADQGSRTADSSGRRCRGLNVSASAADRTGCQADQGLLPGRRPEPAAHCRSTGPNAGIPSDAVPSGTQLPIVPKFKGDATVRYSFPLGGDMDGHVQGSIAYQSPTNSQPGTVREPADRQQPAYGMLDLTAGIGWRQLLCWSCSRTTPWTSAPRCIALRSAPSRSRALRSAVHKPMAIINPAYHRHPLRAALLGPARSSPTAVHREGAPPFFCAPYLGG